MASKLNKIKIRNFRAIGSNWIELDLDEIVVLVGPNNVGKSSILKAYEMLMLDSKMSLDDFHSNQLTNQPEMELHTWVSENDLPSEKWRKKIDDDWYLVKESFVWSEVGVKSERKGFLFDEDRWATETDDEKVPWGAKNIAQIHRPFPHRIDAFENPENQASGIIELFEEVVKQKLELKKNEDGDESNYAKLIRLIKELQEQVIEDGQDEIEKIETDLSDEISKVFPNYKISFDAHHESDLDNNISFFNGKSQLKLGPNTGYQSSIENQGSGARRTLILAALRSLAEIGRKIEKLATKTKLVDLDTNRPQVLLIDEPEICLHPSAVREMTKALYDLPLGGRWQVVLTTHSPQFIDFSRDNTTIIKVSSTNEDNQINATTLYKPSKVNLGVDDKENLRLLNMLDPYVAEFFFGGKCILVEGDTEYTAFNYVMSENQEKYRDHGVHVLRARGKATLVSLMKILNHFGTDYSVLHDADNPLNKNGDGNAAWGINQNILDIFQDKPESISVRLVASLRNFEEAYLLDNYNDTKPYNALQNMKNQAGAFKKVEQLLDALIDHSKDLPAGAIEWADIEELKEKVEEINAE